MHNTCVSSSLALRCKGSVSFSLNDYTYCSNDRFCRHPFIYTSPLLQSSSLTCCACCANENSLLFRMPISPSYLYGLRQSTLIQRITCKKVILGGMDRVYSRLPSCDVDRRCYCEKVCSFPEKGVCRRRGRLGKGSYGYRVYEGSSESCRLDDASDEAEVMLSLFTEEASEELFDVRGRKQRSFKKLVVEKRGNGGGRGASYRGKKQNIGPGMLESSLKFESESARIKSRQEDKRRKEETKGEALSKGEGLRVTARDEQMAELLRENRKARARKEERKESLSNTRSERVREKAREETLRESLKGSAREEEREDLLRRETHRQRLRKDGSSCSSYYSLSSTGEFENETESQVKQEEFEELSRKYKLDFRGHGEVEEGVRRQGDRAEQGLVLRNESTGVGDEWNWRKESEKKLMDVSAEEIRSQEELSEKKYFSGVHDGVHGKASYKKYDGREEQTTSSVKFDEGNKQHMQTGDEVVRQSETWAKYKKSSELPASHGANFVSSSGSQKQHSGRQEISTKSTSSVHEAREHYDKADYITREEEYRRKSRKNSQSSDIQETNMSKTSTSQAGSAATRKDQEKASTTTLSSVYDAKEKHHQAGRFTSSEDSRRTSHHFVKEIDKARTSISQSEQRVEKREESSNSVYGSYQDSRERRAQTNKDEAGRSDSGVRVGIETNTSVLKYSGAGTIGAVEGSRRESEVLVTPPSSQLVSRGESRAESSSRFPIEKASPGISNIATPELHLPTHDIPLGQQHETVGGTRRDETIGQPLEFISQEDALGSADRLQKTSTYYVGEFVEKVRHEISSSEIHREKKNYETKMAQDHEQSEQQALTAYVSRDSQLKKRGTRSRHSSPGSGTKGPSDEMWHVTEPSNQEPPETEALGKTESASDIITKRSGRSMWNIIGDIVRLRWASLSTDHSAAGKSGRRSSPNLSTNSEAWFSGHEPEESIHDGETSQERSTQQESMYIKPQEEVKIWSGSQGESSIQSSSKDNTKLSEEGSPSYAEVVAQGTTSGKISFPSGEGTNVEHTGGPVSGAAMASSTIPLPAIRLKRSPAVERVSEAGVVDASAGGEIMQVEPEKPVSSVVSELSQPEAKDGELKQRKFQRADQFTKDRFDEWEDSYRIEMEQRKVDELFMREALLEARQAADSWEVPVGAVLVHDGKIIARGYNLVEELRDSTAHAEMICIREASKILRTWRLSETTLYVTLEPCPMCAGAILQARINTVVWGAPNKLLGADGSWIRLFPSGEGSSLEPSDKPPAPVHPFHPKITIRRNVLESECAEVMRQFFQRRRKKKEKKQDPTTPPSCLPIASHPTKFFTKMHDVFHIMFCL